MDGSAALAERGAAWLRRLSARPNGGRGGGSARLIGAVEIALVLLLGVLVGRLILTVIAPGPIINGPLPAPSPTAANAAPGNPFRLAESNAIASAAEARPDAAETTLDLALHGAWVEAGGRGSAIIRTPDGKQKRFSVGETICCGATLERVYPDQVTILRGGAREALHLANKLRSTAPENARPDEPLSRLNFSDIVSVEINRDAAAGLQLALNAGVDAASFERLGLRNGDILISVNGRPAPSDPATLAALIAELDGALEATLVVERDGVQIPLDISLADTVDRQRGRDE